MVEEAISFGRAEDFDHEPTVAEQMEAIALLRGGAIEYIVENGWQNKRFKEHYIQKQHLDGTWSIGLRCDEVTPE